MKSQTDIARRLITGLAVSVCAFISSSAASMPDVGECLPGYSKAQFVELLDARGADKVEGVWHYADDAITVGIERYTDIDAPATLKYRIILLESDDVNLIPGMVVGYIADGVDSGRFYVYVYSEFNDNGVASSPVKCVASINDNSQIIQFEKKSKLKLRARVNFSRLLPSFFKALSISAQGQSVSVPLGFVKLYPKTSTLNIRYL